MVMVLVKVRMRVISRVVVMVMRIVKVIIRVVVIVIGRVIAIVRSLVRVMVTSQFNIFCHISLHLLCASKSYSSLEPFHFKDYPVKLAMRPYGTQPPVATVLPIQKPDENPNCLCRAS
jgi:hypothetical protein